MTNEFQTSIGPVSTDVIADQTDKGQIVIFKSAEKADKKTEDSRRLDQEIVKVLDQK